MSPKIISIEKRTVIGMQSFMHHNEHRKIVALWQHFMPRQKEIQTRLNSEFIALQIYDDFNVMDKPFDIWACVEVISLKDIPDGMTSFIIPEGEYAVFNHKGLDAANTYQSIMTEWLPTSGYQIDHRPHFQVMGDKYKNGHPDSEEEFYVPIKLLRV